MGLSPILRNNPAVGTTWELALHEARHFLEWRARAFNVALVKARVWVP